ncbi:unnamed protein product (macronuclear) [Paramecium tetraurelia]|uniref:Trichohyalin-plectin-homology domain-containing protein n=1 Tax=Paramecium tetraurelia TaxID=5888 RepID=A0CV72_PARTE|nr:uncharacterized protein GSPATT00010857001 [Paramecium tetraurelia]CAK74689.1 unnamed protein product [Paramecium tetraurelia]|eukprot:XP_001442086.1 hypothetical protein (macronuclear) [Paramecium tetraurelia strain d4-2]
MEHHLYIEKITEERRIRDEQQNFNLGSQDAHKDYRRRRKTKNNHFRNLKLQDSRRLQSKLNISFILLKSDERNQKVKEQNKRVKQLLEKFRQEKLQQETQKKQLEEQREEEIKQKLLQIKEKFKVLSTDEIKEHQNQYKKYQEEHQQQLENLRVQKKSQETYFSQQVQSRIRSRTYQSQLDMMKEEEQKRKESEERIRNQIKHRFAYDQIVKENFLPKISHSIDQSTHTIINKKQQNQISPIKSDSKILGNQYLRQIRKLPKRPRIQSQMGVDQSSSSTLRRDYLSEIRQHSKRKTPQAPIDIKLQADMLERESRQAYTKNKLKGDQLLMDSIKQKMLLLEI